MSDGKCVPTYKRICTLLLRFQKFGPELSAIVEDDAEDYTRWRYFLRYMQGKVNQKTIDPFDSKEEGYRNFIFFAFHPSVTDTVGMFHMLRQFLVILDSILDKDGYTAPPIVGVGENTLPPTLEHHLQVCKWKIYIDLHFYKLFSFIAADVWIYVESFQQH